MKIHPLEYKLGYPDSTKYTLTKQYRIYEHRNKTYLFGIANGEVKELPYHIHTPLWDNDTFRNGVAVACNDFACYSKPESEQKIGLIDVRGNVRVPFIHTNAGESFLGNRYIAFEKNGLFAYFDADGNMIHDYMLERVNFDYDWLSHYCYDLVKVNGLYGVLNYRCQWTIKPEWKEVSVWQLNSYCFGQECVIEVSDFDGKVDISSRSLESIHYDIQHRNARIITLEQERFYDFAILTDANGRQYIWKNSDQSILPLTGDIPDWESMTITFKQLPFELCEKDILRFV